MLACDRNKQKHMFLVLIDVLCKIIKWWSKIKMLVFYFIYLRCQQWNCSTGMGWKWQCKLSTSKVCFYLFYSKTNKNIFELCKIWKFFFFFASFIFSFAHTQKRLKNKYSIFFLLWKFYLFFSCAVFFSRELACVPGMKVTVGNQADESVIENAMQKLS